MSELRKKTRLMSQINVVPYIDVMLVLLVIFMVTAPLINTSLIELPSVSRTNQPPAAPLEVMIRKDGRILLRDRETGSAERPVDYDTLVYEVKKVLGRNRAQPVVISADRDVAYRHVVQVMDMLQSNGVARVGLLTRPLSS
ncbi:MAG TPA: protein TolR [Burkholderiales bacterium]|nr:protein TolR [Burkholderiales bacterium]